jgi:DnaJ-class molecular chaperone
MMNLFLWLLIASFLLQSLGSFFDQSNFHFNFNNRPHQRSGVSNDDEYYKILNIPKTASDRDIKLAYHKRAMKMHPDRGGNEEQFKKLVEAYEVLSDKNKRQLYDKFGKAGLNHHHEVGGDDSFPEHFRDLFNGFGRSFSMPIFYRIELPLEDFFSGRKLTIVLPGSNEKVILDILPGLLHGSEIKGKLNGKRDVIFILQEKIHPIFRRKNADLLIEIRISLLEALGGFKKVVKQLDGKELKIVSPRNLIVKFDDVFMVEGMGMPIFNHNQEIHSESEKGRGKLFVKVKIDMPERMESFSSEEKEKLLNLLTSSKDDLHGEEEDEDITSLSSTTAREKTSQSTSSSRKVHILKRSSLDSFGEVGSFANADEDIEGDPFSHPFGNFF